MAITRAVPTAIMLDKIDCGEAIPASQQGGITGWAEAKQSISSIQQSGRPALILPGRHVNAQRVPVLGYYGDAFTEIGTQSKTQPVEIIGGCTHIEIIAGLKLTAAPNMATARFQLQYNGNTFGLNVPQSSIGVTTDYILHSFGPVPANLFPANGETDRANIYIEYTKASPAAQSGMGDTYNEGILFVIISFAQV